VGRLAQDVCLYSCANFGFVKLPDAFTTGSSIMPHKKNPDIFELTRAKCNRMQALPMEVTLVATNLPSGYFRDLQLIKENFLPAFDSIIDIINMVDTMLSQVKVNTNVATDSRYKYMYSVEEVNRRVSEGMPFRDSYKQVGLEIEAGNFEPRYDINHTHEGSIGNLCNNQICELFNRTLAQFDFDTYHKAFENLLKP
jgi:argininosuccinate lyase